MKKLFTIAVLLFVVVSLSACTSKGSQENTNNNSVTKGNQEKQTMKKSISELMQGNDSVKCTFNADDEGVMGQVTIYAGKGNGRTEYNMQMNGQVMKGYSISDEEWMYSWQDGQKTGMKMNLKEMADMDDESSEGVSETAVDFDEEYDLNCENWNYNKDIFTPPADVDFQDYTKTLQKLNDSMDSGELDMCGSCAFIPDETQKAECLTQLGCE